MEFGLSREKLAGGWSATPKSSRFALDATQLNKGPDTWNPCNSRQPLNCARWFEGNCPSLF
jgi:hypothetical protein